MVQPVPWRGGRTGSRVNAEAQTLAHNMSAPPRTVLNFSALVPPADATGDAVADGAGLTFVCRLDARALLPDSHQTSCPGRFYDPELKQVHERLRMGLVYARTEAAGRKRALSGAFAQTRAMPIEAVADALRDLLAGESLAAAGLPRFGLLLEPHGSERAVLPSFKRTLAILARRRGNVFLRDADPIAWTATEGKPFDLWMPAAPPGRTS